MPQVGIELLLVPDGLSFAAGGGKAHIALQVTPSRKQPARVALEDWPHEVAKLAYEFELVIGTLNGNAVTPVATLRVGSEFANYFPKDDNAPAAVHRRTAAKLWSKVFDVPGGPQFDDLYMALGSLGEAQGLAGNPPRGRSNRTAELQMFFAVMRHGAQDEVAHTAMAGKPATWRKIAGWMERGPSRRQRELLKTLRTREPDRGTELAELRASFQAVLFPTPELLRDKAAQSDAEALAADMFRQLHLALYGALDEKPEPEKPEPDDSKWGEDPVEAAGRKLSALLSIPTLAAYLGVGVEITVDLAELSGHGNQFALAARFPQDDGTPFPNEALAWTMCDLDVAAPGYFGPAPDPNSKIRRDFDRGLLQLGAELAPREPRFVMDTHDVINMAADQSNSALYGDTRHFRAIQSVTRRRGLVIYDMHNENALNAELEADAAQDRLPPGADSINWADELLRGYRPDIALAPIGAPILTQPEARWRPPTARLVTCEDTLFDKAFYALPAVARMRHRDHGYAMAVLEEIKGSRAAPHEVLVQRDDEMFSWAGESVAVAARLSPPGAGAWNQVPSDPKKDLGLTIEYELSGEPDEGLLPLRDERAYAIGARLVFGNGVGLTFAAAKARYAMEEPLLLGDAYRNALTFPAAPPEAPGIHLHWLDPIVSAPDPSIAARGESVLEVVVRNGGGMGRRFVTPPRVSFDQAELQGQFDGVKKPIPPGALSGSDGLWRFGVDGAFPEARFGRRGGAIRWLKGSKSLVHVKIDEYPSKDGTIDIDSDRYNAFRHNQARGTVAILGPQLNDGDGDNSTPGRFYPHAGGRVVAAQLVQKTYQDPPSDPKSAGSARSEPEYRVFWNGSDQTAAKPLYLEFVPGRASGAEFDSADTVRVERVDHGNSRLPLLRVRLGKAETYELQLSVRSDIPVQAPPAAAAEDPPLKAAILRVVHAVSEPLTDPDVTGQIDGGRRLVDMGLNAVSVSVRDPAVRIGVLAGALPTWPEKVAELAHEHGDMLKWPSEEGGDTTFFVGRVKIDRKSTGTLRARAFWKAFDDGTVSRQNERWVRNIAKRTATLFEVEVERAGPPGMVDILQKGSSFTGGQLGELRHKAFPFKDDAGRACELEVTLLASTAFPSYYAKGATDDTKSETFTVWKECNFRPPPVPLRKIDAAFRWEDIEGQGLIGRRRSTRLRIYLGEKWYASGVGEELGIVLKRQGHDKPAFAPYLSAAGGDPTRDTAAAPGWLTADHFAPVPGHDLNLEEDVALYLPEADEGAGGRNSAMGSRMGPEQVDVLRVTPQFNEVEGLFCDLDIRLVQGRFNPYNAFLHLGLVRFQPHGVAHLRASHPVKDAKTKVYLLPDRELVVNGKQNTRTVVLRGSGYSPPRLAQGERPMKPPLLTLKLLGWDENTLRWMPIGDELAAGEPRLNANMEFEWTAQVKLPEKDRYVLLAEEHERLPVEAADGTRSPALTDGERMVYSCLLYL